MTLAGNITVMSASINGPFVAGRPDGTVSAGTCNQIYGITRFWQSLDVRDGGWWRGTMMYESGMLNIAQGASLNCIGPAAFASTLNANGGVNIPLAVGASTDTGAVNRLYAAGMGGVTDIFPFIFSSIRTASQRRGQRKLLFLLLGCTPGRTSAPIRTARSFVLSRPGRAMELFKFCRVCHSLAINVRGQIDRGHWAGVKDGTERFNAGIVQHHPRQ